jgi:two-component system, LytTR family, sensor kinase
LVMRKALSRIFLIVLAFEMLREIGANIPLLIRSQPAFTSWQSRNGIVLQIEVFCNFLLYALVSYAIFYKCFVRSKKRTLSYWVLGASGVIALRYLVEELIFPSALGFRNYSSDANLAYYYIDNLYFACLYSAFGVVYFFIQRDALNQLSQARLQLANKQTELSFLRSQVNPHFLFNSLNNIYSLVYHESDQSLTAIAKLSDLLRYMLYDTNEKVPLQKELDYINKYIELQQMRFEHAVPVQMKVEGSTDRASIPPLLLIPFVENAFKHGDLKSQQPITVDVSVDDTAIRFHSSNAVGHHQKDASGGIGLENVRRRLELLYPGKHTLQVQKTAAIFNVQLEIRK